MKLLAGMCLAALLATGLRADDLEGEARAVERMLVAPCCWRQVVAEHFSPEADQMRQEIRSLLASGKTRQEILDQYVAQYGPAILVKPPYKGFNILGYLLPGAVLLLVGVWLVRYLGRRRSPESAPVQAQPSVDPRYAARLEQELRERDS